MDDITVDLSGLNNTNMTCPTSLAWTQDDINGRKARLTVCIIATIIHSIFWLQLVLCSSVRQKTMQWLYAYLVTDLLLLFRFFFIYIVRTASKECKPSRAWIIFVCYFEATVDNYLNILEVYILLALNICRYIQIVYNKNAYQVHKNLLILTHIGIYLTSLVVLFVQFYAGWSIIERVRRDRCEVSYTNIYIQIFNILTGFAVPIILNILVIYASVRHVRLTSTLRKSQHHVSAREKYHRSLVIQFLVFYIIWVALWSPNVIIYQISVSINRLTDIVRLLNFIEIALDPIIIAALDIRFWLAWKKIWIYVIDNIIVRQPNQRQIQPSTRNVIVFSVKTPQIRTTAF